MNQVQNFRYTVGINSCDTWNPVYAEGEMGSWMDEFVVVHCKVQQLTGRKYDVYIMMATGEGKCRAACKKSHEDSTRLKKSLYRP